MPQCRKPESSEQGDDDWHRDHQAPFAELDFLPIGFEQGDHRDRPHHRPQHPEPNKNRKR